MFAYRGKDIRKYSEKNNETAYTCRQKERNKKLEKKSRETLTDLYLFIDYPLIRQR